MKRVLYNKLIAWKNSESRKPLLLQGARQVGKTYLVSQFAENEYKNFIYLNFEQKSGLNALFEDDLSPDKIIENISLYLGKKIEEENTLLFFDEIQVSAKALTSLKYFYEQKPTLHIIAAGSLLGVSFGKTTSFPVGKVNFLNLYPMSFLEFLNAIGEELLVDKILNINGIESFPQSIHNKLISQIKLYLFIGGMPEAVQDYIIRKDVFSVRKIQLDILDSYQRDFSKYTDKNQAVKISELWRSIPFQLARENKKFKYSEVRKGGRSSKYEQTIEWLQKAGLINVAYNVSIPNLPLSAFSDMSKFKIYLNDNGLLGAMLDVSSSLIVDPKNSLFEQFNGVFIENFVAAELTTYNDEKLFYWTSKSDAEVDFLIQRNNRVYPVEVKSGMSRNLKSLQSYISKYNPNLSYRISPRNFLQSDKFINMPLYLISFLNKKDN
jgi:predicted AAA+ superfamily ATPase